MGALQQFGVKDKVTGIIEKLPLSSTSYDPELEARKLYGQGRDIVVWNYSHREAKWGEPFPWKPEMSEVKEAEVKECDEAVEDKPLGERTLKDLSKKEKQVLYRMFGEDASNNDIIRRLGLRRETVYQSKCLWKKNLKASDSPASASEKAEEEEVTQGISCERTDELWDEICSLCESIITRNLLIKSYRENIAMKKSSNHGDARQLLIALQEMMKTEVL